MVRDNVEAIYPLSPMQQGMLFHTLYAPRSGVYFDQLRCTFQGELDVAALRRAWQRVLDRHPALRTRFVWERQARPLQVVYRRVELPWERLDWRGLTSAEQEERLASWLQADRERGFDLGQAPLMRAALFRTADDAYAFVWSSHHILLDGWSLSLVLQEVFTCYEAFRQGQDAPLESSPPYRDYIVWLQQRDMAQAEAFWRRALRGFATPTPLTASLPRPPERPVEEGQEYAEFRAELPAALVDALQGLARRCQVTLNTLLQGAWALLLSCYTGEEDVLFGATVSGRPADLPGVDRMVGLFINTLPVRVRVPPGEPLVPWLRSLQAQQVGARQYEYSPLVEIQGWSDVPRGQPLFESILVFENYPSDAVLQQWGESLQVRDVRFFERTNYPLTVVVEPDDGLLVRVLYDARRFDRGTAARIVGHLRALLGGMATDPDRLLADVPLLTPEERQQVLVAWNDTRTSYPREACVHELFEAQAERTPDAVAMVFEEQQLAYGALNRRANQLARHLRGLGVGPNVPVGIGVERSLDMVVGILGILKAGGAYVPLDPTYPRERLAFMLADTRVPVLVCHEHLLERLPASGARVVRLDADWPLIALEGEENVASGCRADDLAYIMYTSGSTGMPKGVSVVHRGIVRLVKGTNYVDLTADEVFLQFAPLSFDASTFEIWGSLLNGGRLVVFPPGVPTLAELGRALREHGVTTLWLTAGLFHLMVDERLEDLRGVRQLLAGGDVLSVARVRRMLESLGEGCRLINGYGPTENTAFTCCYSMSDVAQVGASVSIGRPIANTQVYVLDRHLRPVPIGIAGELYIGGDGLARDYYNRPALTAEWFVPNPFGREAGERLYRTGDLVRYLPDGRIEFLGRLDNQVKIRGFRVEPGEIEAALSQHPAVKEAVVVAWEDAPGDKRLVAYVVPHPGGQLAADALRRYLKERLPDYMQPSAFVFLEALPLTPNGKVDRGNLPAPERSAPAAGRSFVAPRTPVELALAQVWADTLGLPEVGVDDNFFELGGDSILSIQIVARAARAGIRFTPRQLFEHQTVAGLAAAAGTASGARAESAGQELVTGPVLLTPIQCWFFEQDLPDPRHWNMSLLLEARQPLEAGLLQEAVRHLLYHHDGLRLRFARAESGWRQFVADPPAVVPFVRLDLSAVPEAGGGGALEAACAELQAGLDLSEGPLVRVALVDPGPGGAGFVLVAAHHLVVDGVSWRVLLEDLEAAYEQLQRGEEVRLPPKTTSYKEWAERLAAYSRSEALREEAGYWLGGVGKGGARLPVDCPDGREANDEASARTVSVALDAEETRALLQEVPAAYRTQVNDALLTVLAQALAEWTGEGGVLIDLEGHGREEIVEGVDLSRTVGWFTTIFPVWLELGGASEPGEMLKAVKEKLRRIPRRGIGYGLLRYLSGDTEIAAALRALPQAEVSFNYLGQFDQLLANSSLFQAIREFPAPDRSPAARRRYLLEVNGEIAEGRLRLDWVYSANVHRRETIEALAWRFMEALRTLIARCRSPEAGGYTPSDFPLAGLDQKALDRLWAEAPRLEDVYPLSPGQQEMFVHSQRDPHARFYCLQWDYVLRGDLDVEAFRRAWQRVVDRHAILRTAFVTEGVGQPCQRVHRDVALPWEQHDWGGAPPREQRKRLEALLRADFERGFVLSQVPLMRCALVRLGEGIHRFIWSHHHLLLDGWSITLVWREVRALYGALVGGVDGGGMLGPARPYRDYIAWLQRQDLSAAESFWRGVLDGVEVPPVRLPEPATPGSGPLLGERQARLAPEATARLESLAQRNRLTLNSLVQGAWALLLHGGAGEEDVLFGVTVTDRPADLAGADSMVGLFINTLPLRVTVLPDAMLIPWLRTIQERQAGLGQYAHTPLDRLRAWGLLPRGTAPFGSFLRFQNYPVDASPGEEGGGLGIELLSGIDWWHYPLGLVAEPGAALTLTITYHRRCFDDADVARMLERLRTLLEGMAEDSELRLGALLQ